MLDVWVQGECTKVSPEASALVLHEHSRDYNIGGAGNLALNLSNLGADTHLYSSVGQDTPGNKIREILLQKNIKTHIDQDADVTTTKTRMIGADGTHLLRLDKEQMYTAKTSTDILLDSLQSTDVVIVSDYNKGVIKKDLVSKLMTTAKRVYVDPKQTADVYKGVYLCKPNMSEYQKWFGNFVPADANKHRLENDWKWLIVTDGANGIHVIGENFYKHIKGNKVELADVSGAGDTVLAIIIHYHEQGISMEESCAKALKGANKVVQHRGVTVVEKNDIEDRIVWTNGVFDLLHVGHLELLKFAKAQGDILIVGINSDDSVKRLKGESRPYNNVDERQNQLKQLPWVDDVVVFDEDTPKQAIKNISPDVIVKGGDYTVETTVGNEMAEVVIFPTVKGFSTTNLTEKVKRNAENNKK
jgi:D-beta-D-heptose 7-phosphate kinase/D-beta-D-heptose 1-phosphate adenosyltransferase